MVAIPVVLKKPVKSRFGVNPVLYQEIEEAIVVVVRPCSAFMQRDVILERHTLLRCSIGECSVAIVVVKMIGIPDPRYPCIRNKQVEKPIVVVIPPDARPSISPRDDTGFLCHIGESAIAIIAIERVFVPLRGRVFSGNIEVEEAIVVIVAPRNASSIIQRFNAR